MPVSVSYNQVKVDLPNLQNLIGKTDRQPIIQILTNSNGLFSFAIILYFYFTLQRVLRKSGYIILVMQYTSKITGKTNT